MSGIRDHLVLISLVFVCCCVIVLAAVLARAARMNDYYDSPESRERPDDEGIPW